VRAFFGMGVLKKNTKNANIWKYNLIGGLNLWQQRHDAYDVVNNQAREFMQSHSAEMIDDISVINATRKG